MANQGHDRPEGPQAGAGNGRRLMSGLPDARECRSRALALLKRAHAAADPQEKQELETAAGEYEKLADELEAFQRDR